MIDVAELIVLWAAVVGAVGVCAALAAMGVFVVVLLVRALREGPLR